MHSVSASALHLNSMHGVLCSLYIVPCRSLPIMT